MNIISWNVNGLRAVAKRDFLLWVKQISPDILCLQEIKIDRGSMTPELLQINGYHAYFNFASKKGYSGVAVYTKKKPTNANLPVITDVRFNQEGRALFLEFEDFSILNIYIPHGGRQKENLDYKLSTYTQIIHLIKMHLSKPIILAGDFNIAHTDIDLSRPKQNRKNIMFTYEERSQIDRLLQQGYIDSFRLLHPEPDNYTWWPYMANARQRNLGWRIDYIFTPAALADRITNAEILKDVMGSDHCPVSVTITGLN